MTDKKNKWRETNEADIGHAEPQNKSGDPGAFNAENQKRNNTPSANQGRQRDNGGEGGQPHQGSGNRVPDQDNSHPSKHRN